MEHKHCKRNAGERKWRGAEGDGVRGLRAVAAPTQPSISASKNSRRSAGPPTLPDCILGLIFATSSALPNAESRAHTKSIKRLEGLLVANN